MARGMDAKAYYLSTGTRATWGTADSAGVHQGSAPANLVELTNIKDLSLNLDQGEYDSTTRGNAGWRATEPTLKDGSVEFEMEYDATDAGFTAILSAWLNRTAIAMAILDGNKATATVMGLWADFKVTGFSKVEALEEGQKVSVTLKPTYSTVAPEWVRVTS